MSDTWTKAHEHNIGSVTEPHYVVDSDKVRELEQERDRAVDEAAYFKHRLKMIIPIFQEARDALTALTTTQVQLRGISLSLADRMDDAGTYNRESYDAEMRLLKKGGDNG